jgi:hypothetical protein
MSAAVASTDRADKVRELHDRLIAQVEALVTGEDWVRYLTVAARFHSYSANNLWLILAQRPSLATEGGRVAGYQTWKRVGRQVNRGAKGIAILAPYVYRSRGTEEADPATAPADSQSRSPADGTTESAGAVRVLRGFKVVHVFAQSDTTGDDLPEVRPVLLEGEGALWDALAAQVVAAGFTVSRGDCGRANGCTNFAARTVVVAEHLSGKAADKTLAHELGHVLLGHEAQVVVDRDVAEIEAESVAYVVCNALGIDSASYSLAYVAGWSGGSVERIRRTAERVVSTAHAVLAAMAPAEVEDLAVSA